MTSSGAGAGTAETQARAATGYAALFAAQIIGTLVSIAFYVAYDPDDYVDPSGLITLVVEAGPLIVGAGFATSAFGLLRLRGLAPRAAKLSAALCGLMAVYVTGWQAISLLPFPELAQPFGGIVTTFEVVLEALANLSTLFVAALAARLLGFRWHAWAGAAVLIPLLTMELESGQLAWAELTAHVLPPLFFKHLNMLNVVAHVVLAAYAWWLRDRVRREAEVKPARAS